MEIKLGEFILVHSGLVLQINNLPISVKLRDEIEGDYTFIFNFSSDSSEKGLASQFNAIDTHTMQINLTNFNNIQNAGNTEIIDVGTLGMKPLFLNYRIFDLPNCGKTIQFNFYVKEVKNGK